MRVRSKTFSAMDSRHSSQDSLGSDSVYPPSTDSGSLSSLPTPLDVNTPRNMPPSEKPIVIEQSLLGQDELDVSYRLRLLVNNQYFLPPAHSKPMLVSQDPPPAKKDVGTGFRDLFRPTKKPSKEELKGLRGTSDLPIFPVRRKSESSTVTPKVAHAKPPMLTRVAVLREQLPDLSQAVSSLTPATPSTAPSDFVEINPTDAVDMPPPSGLVVTEDVRTDLLVAHLLTEDSEEERWRRKLLSDAVGHSFIPGHKSNWRPHHRIPRSAPTSPSPSTESTEQSTNVILGRQISSPPPFLSFAPPRNKQTRQDQQPHRTALAPPPRTASAFPMNPLFSHSQSELSSGSSVPPRSAPTSPSMTFQHVPTLSNSTAISSPIPHSMTPPPILHPTPNRPSVDSSRAPTYLTRPSSPASMYSQSSRTPSELAYSSEPQPRHSLALSALRDGRVDHSDGPAPPTPTFSSSGAEESDLAYGNETFQTARSSPSMPTFPSLFIPPRSPLRSPPIPLSKASSNRNIASPPPRLSSSLGHTTLQLSPAPPRKTLAQSIRGDSGSGRTPSVQAPGKPPMTKQKKKRAGSETSEDVPSISVQPTTPPTSRIISETKGRTSTSSQLPYAKPGPTKMTIHSAPPQDTSFFDSLPASMTDFSEDDGEDSENEQELEPPRIIRGIGRFGNHSSPSVVSTPYDYYHHHNEGAYGGIATSPGWNASQTSFVSRTGGLASSASSIKSTKSTRSLKSFFKRSTKKDKQRQKQPQQPSPAAAVAHQYQQGAEPSQPAKYYKAKQSNWSELTSSSTASFKSASSSPAVASSLPYYHQAPETAKVLTPQDVTRKSMSSSRASHSVEEGPVGSGVREFEGLLARHLNKEKEEWEKIKDRVAVAGSAASTSNNNSTNTAAVSSSGKTGAYGHQ